MRLRLLLLFLLFSSSLLQAQESPGPLLKKGIDEMFSGDYAHAIKDLNASRMEARKSGSYKQEFLSINNLGLTYFMMLDYGNALSLYLEAYQLAVAHRQPTDEMIVLNNIAILYIKDKNPKQAEQYFHKSYDIAVENKVVSRIGLYASNLAKLHYEQHDFSKASEFTQIAIGNLEEGSQVMADALITKYQLLQENGQYDQVITNGLKLLQECQNKKFGQEEIETFSLLGKAYFAKGNFDLAENAVGSAIRLHPDNELKLSLFEQLSRIAIRQDNISAAISAKDNVIRLTESIEKNKNRALLTNSKLRFELAASQHELETDRALTESRQKYYAAVTIFLIFIGILFIWIFSKRAQSAKQKRMIAESNLLIKELELESQKINSKLLEKELKEKELLHALETEKQKENEARLEREVEARNRQLSQKILFQSTRNELIEDLVGSISATIPNNEDPTLLKSVSDLKTHLRQDVKWEEFSNSFENVNHGFITSLKSKHPGLTANDIRFLSFVYLNLSNKEIASLLFISPEACRKRKERICRKMGLDPLHPLTEYLNSLVVT